ncbi:isochorismatase family protein [Labrenzia sp. CE80]|uniref:isochorismatase family protein n=1 Tax=Labrenzia sp. CE80 TaxID=1788986 RepID=UPI00129BB035|nr:isochorismatase family protein [Labrenzia sp. CE80]
MSRTLLVIDIQNDYFPGGVLPLHLAEEIESRIVTAIEQARWAGDRIVLVRHVSPAPKGLFAASGTGNAIRAKILTAAGAAPIVIKQVADAFQETDLAKVLEGTTELLVCGMMTQNCVAFTAISRAADSLDVTVIGDLCTGPSEIVHNIALNALGSKLSVATAAETWS